MKRSSRLHRSQGRVRCPRALDRVFCRWGNRPASVRLLRGPDGFTLIEILVVIVILAVMSTFAVLKLERTETSDLQEASERLALLLEAARDEAIASGYAVAWSPVFDANGVPTAYQFEQQSPEGEWQVLAQPQMFSPHVLPDGLRLRHAQINLQALESDQKLILQPSGVSPAFQVLLQGPRQQRRLSLDLLGRATVGALEPLGQEEASLTPQPGLR